MSPLIVTPKAPPPPQVLVLHVPGTLGSALLEVPVCRVGVIA